MVIHHSSSPSLLPTVTGCLLASSRYHTPFCKSQSPNPIVENCRNLLHAMQNVSIPLRELTIRYKHEAVCHWSLQNCTWFESHRRRYRALQRMYGRHADSSKACTPISQFYNSFQGKHTCNVHSLFLLIYYVRHTYIQNAWELMLGLYHWDEAWSLVEIPNKLVHHQKVVEES